MPRSADYTIQGFLYQFNKTALEILKAQEDDTITVEGIVEDIEVASSASLTAIQCKYHETSTSFTESKVYKPLLQMLKHFSNCPTQNIRYVLFAHFAGTSGPPATVGKSTLKAALASKDKELKKHIKAVPKNIDLDDFVERFKMEFGPSYEEITKEVSRQLEANGFPACDIETLAYPNTIHLISILSMKHAASERKITKKAFLSDLKAIRTTAISGWTLALRTRKKLLQARRKQMKVHLDKNVRLRYFVIGPNIIEDYDNEIVLFISDYIDKYHYKAAHTETPTMCICAKQDQILDIERRLYTKGIVSENGYIGGEFQEARFFRDPMIKKKRGTKIQREFSLRILSWSEHGEILDKKKCDDLFIIGELNLDSLDTADINVERLASATMKEIKYIMGLSNVYD